MGQITSLFAHKVIAVASEGAPDALALRSELLRFVGLDPDAPIDPKRMLPSDAYYSLCERVAEDHAPGAALSIRVGASMRCDDYGAFGLAWKSAVDLRRSFQRAERYGRVLTSVSIHELRREDGRAFMTLHRAGERRGLSLSNEQTIVAVTQISREVSARPFSPLAVYFKHEAPADLSAHEAYFRCPVHYGADRNAIEVSETQLRTPNHLGDAGLSEFFDAHLEKELAALSDEQALDKRVRIQVSQTLSDGPPTVADVARRLGVSARTLQRRLSEQNLAFQDLVDDARRELAEKLLRGSDYTLAEVAFLTGFSEQSTFSRAFKRWSGRTPASFRREPR